MRKAEDVQARDGTKFVYTEVTSSLSLTLAFLLMKEWP